MRSRLSSCISKCNPKRMNIFLIFAIMVLLIRTSLCFRPHFGIRPTIALFSSSSSSSSSAESKLVIVESPTKAKTIQKLLTKLYPEECYIVDSCMGHIRDLPSSTKQQSQKTEILGVDVHNDYEPIYVIPPEKQTVLQRLKQKAKQCSEVILATDEDREGEAISFHLKEALNVPSAKRVRFGEITSQAIEESFSKAGDVDMNLVNAQECRRVLDRLAGFSMNPVLWKKLSPGLTAGRVQSVGLALIVERELERLKFQSAEYWDLEGSFEENMVGKLDMVDGKRVASGRDFDENGKLVRDVVHLSEQDAHDLLSDLSSPNAIPDFNAPNWTIVDISTSRRTLSAPPPFITSTLQQEANKKLGLSVVQSMSCAQKLYENGVISYMRTDNPNLSNEAKSIVQSIIHNDYGEEYVTKLSKVRKKGKNVQEAHEAIRPSIMNHACLTPAQLRNQYNMFSSAEHSLYEMIYKRTLSSEMENAVFDSTSVLIAGLSQENKNITFKVTGSVVVFDGYRRIWDVPSSQIESDLLPKNLTIGQCLNCTLLAPNKHQTKPPPRFTEASFVQELERIGVGRPSTYASVVRTLTDRGYILRPKASGIGQRAATGGNDVVSRSSLARGPLTPSLTALVVHSLLSSHAPMYLNPNFTSAMEERLDTIANGNSSKTDAISYLREYYEGQEGLSSIVRKMHTAVDESARKVPLPFLQDDMSIFIGPWGPYIQTPTEKTPLPASLAVEWQNLTPDILRALLQKKSYCIGTHPNSTKPIYFKLGRFGAYLQHGSDDDDGKRTHTLPMNLRQGWESDAQFLTLEEAVGYVNLPRKVGTLEKEEEVWAGIGRYGSFLKYKGQYVNIDGRDVLTIEEEDAKQIVLDEIVNNKGKGKSAKGVLHHIGDKENSPITIKNGRFGPYLNFKKINAKLPSQYISDFSDLSLDEAWSILGEKINKQTTTNKQQKTTTKEAITLPPPPKRPPSSYLLFCTDKRPLLMQNNDNSSLGEISKQLSKLWADASKDEKQHYQEKAQERKAEYERQKKIWEEQCRELKTKAKKSQSKPQVTKTKSKTKKKEGSSSGIPKPKSAYLHFCAEKRPDIQKRVKTLGEVSKELAKLWGELDEEHRKPYHDMAEKDRARYDQDSSTKKQSSTSAKTSGRLKRAPSAYILFCSDHREQVSLDEDGNKRPFGDITKSLATMWKECDDETREVYAKKAEKEKEKLISLVE